MPMRGLPTGIFKSLRIAFKNLFRPNMVIQYPKQRAIIPERARWAVEIKPAQDGSHRCQACRICEGACPHHCIKLDITTAEDRSKHIDHWWFDRGSCMMCGLCVEACPFDAIRMGHDYELAHADPALLVLDLLPDTPAYVRPKPARPVDPNAGDTDA
ncbi:MAG: 4Fe-4S binding protein [Actinomycetes bacterium]|nr:4Fe-4S binding protein [Actinomycetes bacterium]